MRIAFLLAALAVGAAAQTFPIAGVVLDAASGSPMRRVRVTLSLYGHTSDQRAVVTAGDGRFSFEAPKGKFVLLAEYRGLREPFGQRGPGIGFNVSIFTGPDQDTSNLQFRWFAPGAISGKVTDDHAEPVQDALVQLVRVSVAGGRKTRGTVAWARTNDLGQYRFGQRMGGTYYLAVTGEPWYTARTPQFPVPGIEREEAPPAQAYVPVYYPNATDPSGARPLELAPGAEVTADFRLSAVTGVNVTIHCPHPPGKSVLATLLNEGVAGVDSTQRQVWIFADEQTIAGVLPGHYTVVVAGRNGYTDSARQTIDVGQSDVSVNLAMQPAPTVTGKVVFKDPSRRPLHAAYIRLIDISANTARAVAIDPSGAFSFATIQPGKRRVQISGSDGFFVSQLQVEGAPVDGPVIDIEPGAVVHLNIVASSDIGTLKGFVMDGDKPVAGVLAVLAPKNGSKDPGEYRGFQTDSDGSFDYQNVRAGDYVLFAVDRLDLEYTNLDEVRPYLASGKPIRISPRAEIVENTSLTSLIPQK